MCRASKAQYWQNLDIFVYAVSTLPYTELILHCLYKGGSSESVISREYLLTFADLRKSIDVLSVYHCSNKHYEWKPLHPVVDLLANGLHSHPVRNIVISISKWFLYRITHPAHRIRCCSSSEHIARRILRLWQAHLLYITSSPVPCSGRNLHVPSHSHPCRGMRIS